MPPASPTLFPIRGKQCLPALVSVETEASLEVSADLGHLPVLGKVVAQPLVPGPSGRGPERVSEARSALFSSCLCDP